MSDLPLLTYKTSLDWVTEFNYLGVSINCKGTMQFKTAPIWGKATRAQFKLAATGKSLSFDTKVWLHKTMVDPILMHGVEIWACQGRLKHLKVQRVYGIFNDQGTSPLPGEAIQWKYVRLRMGLPRKALILAFKGDSGVRPLYIKGLARSMK